MQLKEINKSYNKTSGSYIFTDFHPNSATKVALILRSNSKEENSNQILAQLLEKFQKSFYTEEIEIEKRMEKTFLEMHWKVASIFHKKEKKYNISALLLVLKNDTIYLIQSGRLSVMVFEEEAEFFGLGVKQLIDADEPVNMLGTEQDNISYKVFSRKLKPGAQIVALPVFSAQKLKDLNSKSLFKEALADLAKGEAHPIFSFSLKAKKKFAKKNIFSLSAIFSFRVLAIVVIVASFYAILGKKWIQGWISSGKEFVNEKKVQNIDIERILSPDQKLAFRTIDKLPQLEKITQKPYFDSSHLFLVSNNKIVTIYKNSYKLIWEKSIKNEIVFVNLLRNNMIILVDASGKQFLLNRTNGELIWEKQTRLNILPHQDDKSDIIVLDYIKDGRLNKNYYVTARDSKLKIYSANSGELVNEKQFDQAFDFISDYDYIRKCFYVVLDNELIKLDLIIE